MSWDYSPALSRRFALSGKRAGTGPAPTVAPATDENGAVQYLLPVLAVYRCVIFFLFFHHCIKYTGERPCMQDYIHTKKWPWEGHGFPRLMRPDAALRRPRGSMVVKINLQNKGSNFRLSVVPADDTVPAVSNATEHLARPARQCQAGRSVAASRVYVRV